MTRTVSASRCNSLAQTRAQVLCASMLASIVGTACLAQSNPSTPTSPTTPTTITRSNNNQPLVQPDASQGAAWATDRFKFPSVGFSMNLPAGCISQGTMIGTSEVYQIKPDEETPVWVVTAKVHQTKQTELTVAQAADAVINALGEAAGTFDQTETFTKKDAQRKLIATTAKVIHRESTLRLGGKPTEQFFVSLPEGKDSNIRIVRGITLIHLEPGKFLSMELRVAESNFHLARQTYLDMMQTGSFADIDTLAAARGVSVKAADAFLNTLTPDDYRAICAGKPIFLRLYKPAPTADNMDAVELGYHQLTIREGLRGEADPGAKRTSFTQTDNDRGYLVTIKSRVLNEEPGKAPTNWTRIDSEGYFFVAMDRQSESWTLSMTQHNGTEKKPPVWTETGAREGKSMSVTLMAPGEPPQTRQLNTPSEGYLNVAEVYMLPQLLTRHGAAIEFGFYAYRAKNEAIVLRSDTLKRPGDKPNLWQLTSRASENESPMTSLYNADGTLIRRELGDATVWEPVDPKWLLDLWQRKGYPTK